MESIWKAATTGVALLAALACRDGNGAGPRVAPRELQIVDGTQQSGIRGDDAPSPLRVRVIGSDGNPFEGAMVHWSVDHDAATLEPSAIASDVAGDATTRARELAVTGSIRVVASASGVAPVGFSITAADPCLVASAHQTRLDSVATGLLRASDCQAVGRYYDFYAFTLPAGRAVTMRATSQNFAPLVASFDLETGSEWGEHADDNGAGVVSLRMILPSGATGMGVTANAAATTGAYTLAVTAAEEDVTHCDSILVVPGISTQQRLERHDCEPTGESYIDSFILLLYPGQSINLTQWSPDFVPRLRLRDADHTLLADSSGDGTRPATITFRATSTAYYRIEASSRDASATGSYRLDIQRASASSGHSASPAAHADPAWQPAPPVPRER